MFAEYFSVTQYSILYTILSTAHKEEFKKWRKQHYNEFQNIRKARMLLAQEVDDEDDDDEAMDDKQSHVS